MTFCSGNELFCFGLPTVVLFAGDLAACEQVVAEVGGDVGAIFGYSITLENLAEGGKDYFDITEEGNFFDVFKIVGNFRFPGDCVAAVDLSKPAKSLAHGVALALFGGHKDHVAYKLRSRPNYRHVTLEDVEEFGEFVKVRATEELAIRIQANIVREQVTVGVFLVRHGAELDEPKYLFVLARAGLREEGIATHLERTDNGQQNQ